MRSLNVPGAAFALIQNGRIVHEEGLGVRTLGSKLPVDAHTRFLIASNSKGMATLLLAKMVGEGKLRWDQPVSQLMPAIGLADPEATRKLQVRHLICACTGLPRADLESYFVDPAADSRLALGQLAMLKPTSAFGEQYQYSKTLAGVAGILAGHVADPNAEPLAAFSRAMHDEIWAPLGMNDTDFGDPRTQSGNFATGYLQDVDGRLVPVERGLNATILPYRATGSGISSAHDVALYVANELNEGRLADGRQLVDRTALLARRQHGVSTGRDSWYGMGLMQRRVGGVEYLYHGGYMSGYHSQWIALPGTGLGAVLLTSSDNAFPLVANFPRRVLELIYSAQPIAVARLIADAGAQRKSIAASVRQLSPAQGPAAALASVYAEPLLGTVDVQRTPKGVRFDFGPWGSKMMAKADPGAVGGYDFVAIADGYNQPATFVPGREADGTRTLILSDAQHRYVYRERR
jgi:CubicO group peptidase (beta-lactamase class C family)